MAMNFITKLIHKTINEKLSKTKYYMIMYFISGQIKLIFGKLPLLHLYAIMNAVN